MKNIIFFIFTSLIVFANTIEINKDSWNLVGTDREIQSVKSLPLNSGDMLWSYDEQNSTSPWKCYFKYETLQKPDFFLEDFSLKAGQGFWIYSNQESNISFDGVQSLEEKTITDKWTLFSPVLGDYNISTLFENKDITTIWGYEDNWKLWYDSNKTLPFIDLLTLEKGKGYWLYNPLLKSISLSADKIKIGNDYTILNGNLFNTVAKSTTDSLENIWNLEIKIDHLNHYEGFDIVVDIEKYEDDGTNDEGKITFKNLTLSSGSLSSLEFIGIEGKGDGNGNQLASTFFYNSYNPNNILSTALSLNKDTLNINLSQIMENQDVVSESSFKSKAIYKLSVSFTKAITSNIEGELEIK